ncbi:MAG: 30S ribosomal protein S4 [Candidatus Pacebacteria bacterium]|nr:30S ribosomal protein S4 [Candidatus Paceibacterota bacterium]
MKIGPKYKIARRLKSPVFEKTQTQKFVLSESKKSRPVRRRKNITDYGRQLLEKQKARYSYLLTEKQFSRYIFEAMARKDKKNADALFENLESRLDNVVLRLGLAPTRPSARQMVSHGHIFVNSRKMTIPSYRVSINDVISVKERSLSKGVTIGLEERLKEVTVPVWISLDAAKKEGVIKKKPVLEGVDLLFDIQSVLEFYSR